MPSVWIMVLDSLILSHVLPEAVMTLQGNFDNVQ